MQGEGTLVLTSSNAYRGGSVVEEGVLLGFAESFGVIGRYDDHFTFRGALTTPADAGHSVDIAVNKGGVYGIVPGQDVKVGTLNFADGAKLTVLSLEDDVLAQAYSDKGLTGSVRADKLEGVRPGVNPVVDPDNAFFDTDVKVDLEHGLLQATISRNDKTAAAYAASMVRTIKDQANAFGQARRAELENGPSCGPPAWEPGARPTRAAPPSR